MTNITLVANNAGYYTQKLGQFEEVGVGGDTISVPTHIANKMVRMGYATL